MENTSAMKDFEWFVRINKNGKREALSIEQVEAMKADPKYADVVKILEHATLKYSELAPINNTQKADFDIMQEIQARKNSKAVPNIQEKAAKKSDVERIG